MHHRSGGLPPDLPTLLRVMADVIENELPGQLGPAMLRGVVLTIDVDKTAMHMTPLPSKATRPWASWSAKGMIA